MSEIPIFPYSGTCANCQRERDDLFWHREDRAYYCADVFRCEQRLWVQGMRQERERIDLSRTRPLRDVIAELEEKGL